jgi:hypothetical protein
MTSGDSFFLEDGAIEEGLKHARLHVRTVNIANTD